VKVGRTGGRVAKKGEGAIVSVPSNQNTHATTGKTMTTYDDKKTRCIVLLASFLKRQGKAIYQAGEREGTARERATHVGQRKTQTGGRADVKRAKRL